MRLYVSKKSASLRPIQRIRDEADRFAMACDRSKRDAGTLKTEITGIKGLGPSTAEKLLTKFKSVKKIKGLSEAELVAEVGLHKAKILRDYFAGKEGVAEQ